MNKTHPFTHPARFGLCIFACYLGVVLFGLKPFQAAGAPPAAMATYSHGLLRLSIPYHASRAGSGQWTVEVLDPDDKLLGQAVRPTKVAEGPNWLRGEIKIERPLPLEDLVWHRVHYRFQYDDPKSAGWEGTDSLSQILRTPVIHLLGQHSYLAGSEAAVRVIVTDSKNEVVSGRATVRIELVGEGGKTSQLYAGVTNRRGTTEAHFRFPASLVGTSQLRYAADTPIGSTEFTEPIRIEDKVSILLTTEKPIYQPGQTIHARALALDRADHDAAAHRKLTIEVEDSRGNKVFKKATETDAFGVASAEFGLADEVNLGTYHLRALMGNAEEPTNAAELAVNVERYVLPKFKVAIEFSAGGKKQKHGYRPGDHVVGTVRANYFFGKPVDGGKVTIKASTMDVTVVEVASTRGKTDPEGSYLFDLVLPTYFAGRPLSHGAARVLIEAAVKDSASHIETRGEPIMVSDSPLLITAIPEGGTLAPKLENQVFFLTAYPDGTPAKTRLTVYGDEEARQQVTTDDAGIAIARLHPPMGAETLKVEATDEDGNTVSSQLSLASRPGDEQILLRADRAVYHAGERMELSVFSSKSRGAAYVDVVREGQTILTRDLDLENGQARLSLAASPEMAGTLDINAYLFARDAQTIGDHRLVFIQPADELKIETVADAPAYKPGGEARIRFRVSNSHGAGVQAALGMQVVDEAVFALAEKQPGFAKVFFYLEQEIMKPRYEIHSLGMPEIVEPGESSQSEQRDRAARALFSATEVGNPNRLETQFGGQIPITKQPEYLRRYQEQFRNQVTRLAERLTQSYDAKTYQGNLFPVFDGLKRAGGRDTRDAWGAELRLEATSWYRAQNKTYYVVRSAGPDGQFDTFDDMTVLLQVPTRAFQGLTELNNVTVKIEHDRGPLNGRAEIVGTVIDVSGAVVPGASIELFDLASNKVQVATSRTAKTNASGEFSFSSLPTGAYKVQMSMPGFKAVSRGIVVQARDRAVISATLDVGVVTQAVEVAQAVEFIAAPPMTMQRQVREMKDMAAGDAMGIVGGVPGGVPGGQMGGVIGGVLSAAKAGPGVGGATGAAPAARVRSYFPEALYINPEVITDKDGRASIVIPIADSITTWRMAMIASTPHGALGTSSSSLKVFQDFFVDLDMPVTLTQGDRVSIPVGVYNYSGARGEACLKLQPENWFSLVDDVAEKSLNVESGQVGGSQFTLEAKRIGKFKLTLAASLEGQTKRADIVVREIEVIPNGREQSVVFNGRLESSVQHEIRFPANAIAEASKIFVRLYPGPLSQVIEGMDSLLRMPFGCFEQTSSSTYPNVLALDYMKRTKKLTPEVHAKAEGYIANGYQRLLTFEVPGGGFSWFGNAPANKILTAYGLMEFYDMSKVYDVDPKLIERTQAWLAGQQQADGNWKPDTQFINEGATNRYNSDVLRITAYLAWSLEHTGYEGTAVERAKQFVEKHLSAKMDAYTLAVLANFATEYGTGSRKEDPEFTRQAIELLLDARAEKDDQAWWTAEETGVYGEGASASIETTGLAVQALLKWGQASGTARKALAYIAARKDAAGTWGTTQATIMALGALLLAAEKGSADIEGTVAILLNGRTLRKLTLTPANNDLLHQFVFKGVTIAGPGSAVLTPNAKRISTSSEMDAAKLANTVEIRFEGKGGLAYQVVGSYYLPWNEKPEREPLSIDVTYDRTRLAQNDIATATAQVKNNMDKVAKMVMVDLGVPPGFDLLSEDLQDYQAKSANFASGCLSKFSLTATQAILYFDSLAPGAAVRLKFRLHAKYPIRARTFKSRVYEYYDPEVNSIAVPVQLEVTQR